MTRWRHPAALALAWALTLAPGAAGAEPVEWSGPRGGDIDLRFGSLNLGPIDTTLVSLTVSGGLLLSPALVITGRAPVAHLRSANDSSSSLGNLTGGLIYLLSGAQNGLETGAWLDASLSLPTAGDSGDAGTTSSAHELFWIPDPGLYKPNTTTVRLGGHYQHGIGRGFVRASGAAQYLSVSDDEDLLRALLDLSGGARVAERVTVHGGLTTVWNPDAVEGDDDFLHAVTFGVDIDHARGAFGLGLYVPLDELYRDDFEVIGVQIGASLSL